MESKHLKCNETYWSSRYSEKCVCVGIIRYFAKLQFANPNNNGWYHCQEIEEIPKSQKKVIDISDIIR